MVTVESGEPGFEEQVLKIDGRMRTYLVHSPLNRLSSGRLPVVLAFHGGGSNAEAMMQFSGLNEKADQAGFLAVYPNGTGRYKGRYTWNAGNCCAYAQWNRVDDVSFVKAMLEELDRSYLIDRSRVYATGMSNGGMMAYRLASEMAGSIAAIAPVAGAMATEECSPSEPVSVIHFHGREDKFAPFDGGRGERSLLPIDHYSVEHSIEAWLEANECGPEPLEEDLLTGESGDRVLKRRYGPGRSCSEIVVYIIENGGHTWPGRLSPLRMLGRSTLEISANDLMWEFFEKHPKK
jgi:polyhydroxybutyrate depolymerase